MSKTVEVPAVNGTITYNYSATGEKLSVNYKWHNGRSLDPLENSTPTNYSNTNSTKTMEYVGNKVYENGTLKRILLPNGYISNDIYYFYLRDHLGNNAVVANANGTSIQRTYYHPYGKPIDSGSIGQSAQPYKFGGKERENMFGLETYDFSARTLTDYGIFTTMDPLAEDYPWISPYHYCSNNPVNRIDPDGRDDFYFNSNGDLLERIKNDSPDLFYHRQTSENIVYSTKSTFDGSLYLHKSFETVTTNTQIDMSSDLGSMIRTVYAEAAGASADAKLAVAEVIRNRADDNTPNSAANGWAAIFSKVDTYTDVVKQSGQFETVGNNVPRYSNPASVTMPDGVRNELETTAFVQSVGASINATMKNTNTAQGAMYFYSPYINAPSWTNKLQQVTVPNIGTSFNFYKFK